MKADLRMEVKLQEKIERERKCKEEAALRRGMTKDGKKGKERELRKGGVEKNKVEELEQRIESVEEGTIEKSEQKVGKEVELEEKIEKEIRIFRDREDKEIEAEILVEKETIDQEMEDKKDKLEVAKNLLLGAIVMEQILSLYMQSSQDTVWDKEGEIWPEIKNRNTAWDISTAWDEERGYCLEENNDTAWDTQIGYCLEDSQDNGWDTQPEIQAWGVDGAWLW